MEVGAGAFDKFLKILKKTFLFKLSSDTDNKAVYILPSMMDLHNFYYENRIHCFQFLSYFS